MQQRQHACCADVDEGHSISSCRNSLTLPACLKVRCSLPVAAAPFAGHPAAVALWCPWHFDLYEPKPAWLLLQCEPAERRACTCQQLHTTVKQRRLSGAIASIASIKLQATHVKVRFQDLLLDFELIIALLGFGCSVLIHHSVICVMIHLQEK